MEPSFNAAAVGKEAKLNINAAYAHDFAGYENNPRTMYLAADMPIYALKQYHGIGLMLMNEKIGLFNHQRFTLQYAYKHDLWKGTLSIGAQIGLLDEKFDGSKVKIEKADDPAFPKNEVNGNSLDMGLGIYYKHGDWYAGASALHLNEPKIELGETNELKIDATYYLTAGYNIRFTNPFLSLKTSALGRTDGVAWRGDFTARLFYTNENKIMYGGVGYSPTNSVTLMIGGKVHGVMLGYSYEMYTSKVGPGNGSHELHVGYQMDINLQKKGRNKHQSVRIL
jgi:type IX secretion system PorP/SprF family membrane protein